MRNTDEHFGLQTPYDTDMIKKQETCSDISMLTNTCAVLLFFSFLISFFSFFLRKTVSH
jgi:hypothetical protein